jgi:hypothetical protein
VAQHQHGDDASIRCIRHPAKPETEIGLATRRSRRYDHRSDRVEPARDLEPT